MLPELLNSIFKIEKRPMMMESDPHPSQFNLESSDTGSVNPEKFMSDRTTGADKNNIYNDSGKIVDYDPGDAFASLKDMLKKSREGDNSGPGVLKQLLSSLFSSEPNRRTGQLVPNTGTVGGGGPPDHVPGTRQDAALNPTPMKQQRQPALVETVPLPRPRPDYSQPTALDPVAIEQLRQSLLTDAGQRDPNNPNGLAGRMTSPNANVDMRNQGKEAQSIEDSVRGFDGSRQAKIKKGNQQ